MEDKLVTLKEAVKNIKDGDFLGIGGILNNRVPMAIVHEIIRQGFRNLDIIGLEQPFAFDLLIGAGCARSIDSAYFGLSSPGSRFLHMPNIRRAAEQGGVEIKENIGDCIIAGFELGALGIPFAAVRTLSGTDLLKVRQDYFKEIESPYDGEKLIAFRSFNPDVAIIHAQRGDRFGNIEIADPGPGLDEKVAFASERVIVTVEDVVSTEEIKGRVSIPYFLVTAVAKVPWGAHPAACYQFYEGDYTHLEEYVSAAREPEGYKTYAKEYIEGPRNHAGYLERIGDIQRLSQLAGR